jgi:hypothetical protein
MLEVLPASCKGQQYMVWLVNRRNTNFHRMLEIRNLKGYAGILVAAGWSIDNLENFTMVLGIRDLKV